MVETLIEPVAAPQQSASPVEPRPWLAAATLCRREWVRFVRQRNRLIGAFAQPILFWLLFGFGLGPSFRVGGSAAGSGPSFLEYYFPGTLALILLFTAIFATISVIEDRKEGFLQSVLVAPIPRWSMVLGKLVGGSLVAVAQGTLFLLLGYTLGMHLGPFTLLAIVAWMFVMSLSLTALGFLLAWRTDSVSGFHAVMSVLLFPMWLLSGAFFPADNPVLLWIVRLNPLTYGVAGLRRLLYWGAADSAVKLPENLPPMWLCGLVTILFCAVMFALASRASARRTTGDLL